MIRSLIYFSPYIYNPIMYEGCRFRQRFRFRIVRTSCRSELSYGHRRHMLRPADLLRGIIIAHFLIKFTTNFDLFHMMEEKGLEYRCGNL